MSDLVTLNVGGSLYTTTVSTLTCYPDSMLGSMFSGNIPTHRDNNGHYIIDGDGPIFRHVLNFLRRCSLCLPHDFKEWDLLSAEADFFQIDELKHAVKTLKEKRSGEGSRQEMEFIELSFCSNERNHHHPVVTVSYRGNTATLEAIPTLWRFLNKGFMNFFVDGFYSVPCTKESPDRMKIYQEINTTGLQAAEN